MKYLSLFDSVEMAFTVLFGLPGFGGFSAWLISYPTGGEGCSRYAFVSVSYGISLS